MQLTIIGCGNMGSGLAERLSKNMQLFLYDRHYEKSEKIEKKGYGTACKDIKKALDHSKFVILAVKPQNLKEVSLLIKNDLKKGQVLISLLAGIPFQTLKQFLPDTTLVRMMPNLAIIHGEGVIGLSVETTMSCEDKESLSDLCKPLGKIFWLSEDKINGLTALTGSGPAFFFSIVEAMIDSGIALGFTQMDSQALVYQMLQGSLTLLEKSKKYPCELKWQIASPKGTTIDGLKKFEELAIRGGIMNTFLAAYERANKLLLESLDYT